MPELPEVETIARQLRARGVEGCAITFVEVNWLRTIEPLTITQFEKQLVGTTIRNILRVGKWLLFSLDSGRTLMIHLRMSGSFSMEQGSHDRIVLGLSGGRTLYYRDTRKFGRWKLVDDPMTLLKGLGPDALSDAFKLSYFVEEMRRRQRMIKPLLLDQAVIAGLGNIYADEALWEARVHPERLSNTLNDEELETLFKAIRHVLRIGVQNRGTSLGTGKTNYRDLDGESGGHRERVKAYGRSGEPCCRCGKLLQRIVVAQRSTHFCPDCQKK